MTWQCPNTDPFFRIEKNIDIEQWLWSEMKTGSAPVHHQNRIIWLRNYAHVCWFHSFVSLRTYQQSNKNRHHIWHSIVLRTSGLAGFWKESATFFFSIWTFSNKQIYISLNLWNRNKAGNAIDECDHVISVHSWIKNWMTTILKLPIECGLFY